MEHQFDLNVDTMKTISEANKLSNINWEDMKFNYPSSSVSLPTVLKVQVAGDHYKNMAIQPVEFCQKNKLPFIESCVIKYVCRHRNKNKVEDINKAIHFLQILKEIEYPNE